RHLEALRAQPALTLDLDDVAVALRTTGEEDHFPALGARRLREPLHDAGLGLVERFPEVRRALDLGPELALLARRQRERRRRDFAGLAIGGVRGVGRGRRVNRLWRGLEVRLGEGEPGLTDQRLVQVREDSVEVKADTARHGVAQGS